ncbi:MAG: TonB family protein, partial [Phaeodactylibacter sp.]|nr:TonB family protein [Phaeodactylibacter sp.]
DVPEIIECHDTKTYSALLAGGYVPPPPPRITCSDIFRVVEEMPRFPGCEGLSSTEEKRQCSEEKLLEFIYQNLDYLVLARENCIEGTVVIQFVIEKDGSVTNARIVRDIGGQFGEAALSVVRKMKKQGLKWIPGKQRGRPVHVQFTMPIRFRLDCTERPSEVQYEEPAPVPEQEVNKEPMEKAGEALHPMEIVRSGTPLQTQPEGFRLFPNPAVDKINVHFQAQPGPVALAIVNVSGQVLWKQEYNHPGGTLEEQANLAPWPSGTYFLRIEQPGTVQTRTFIKQR